MSAPAPPTLLSPRWDGQPGRLEVLYATVSDPATGTGVWVHHELLAPLDGPPQAHGFAAVFRAGQAPCWDRFGPVDVAGPHGSSTWTTAATGARWERPRLSGRAGRLGWELHWDEDGVGDPLFTFSSWAWERELLPGAQIVPVASAPFAGTVDVDGVKRELSPHARGGVAHIYGHGNAGRWGWLHAELGGGDVLEIVAAVSRQPGLDRLPPLAFVQLRTGGKDWPRRPMVAAPLFRTRLGLPTWGCKGTVGRWRLRVDVEIPETQSVSVPYRDPDGADVTCTNSELADADIVLEHRRGRSGDRGHVVAAGDGAQRDRDPAVSFLVDPPMLVASGAVIEVTSPDEQTARRAEAGVLALFLVVSIALYLNARWVAWLARVCGAESGRDWMLNSGVFHLDHEEAGAPTHVVSAAIFSTYPLWIRLGRRLGGRLRPEGAHRTL